MKDLPFPLAFVIVFVIALIVAVVSDKTRNKDKYAACQREFKKWQSFNLSFVNE